MAHGDATQYILDRFAIQDLINTYHHAVSLHDGDAFAAMFTPDGAWECVGPPDFKFVGAEVGPGLKRIIETAPNLMQVHAPAVIAVNGDTATARSIMLEYGDLGDGSGHVTASGLYDDVLVRVAGAWKFKSRYFTLKQVRTVP
jgi:hypothetical protein